MGIDILLIFTLLSVVAILSLAIVVWVSRAYYSHKVGFVIFGVSVSLFLIFLYFSNLDLGHFFNIVFNRGVFVIAPWMVFSVDLVIDSVTTMSKNLRFRGTFYLSLLLSTFAMTPYFISDVVLKNSNGSIYPSLLVSDLLYWPFIIVLVFPIINLFFKLIKRQKTLSGFEQQRNKTLLLSTELVFVLLILSNVVLPSLGLNVFSTFAPFWMLFWAFSIYYSIANQRLFGIKHIISKLISFLLDGLFLLLTFFLSIWLVNYLNLEVNLSTLITISPAFILLAMLLPIYSIWSRKIVSKIFNLKMENDDAMIGLFIDSLSHTVTLSEIFDETVDILKKVFQVEGYIFFVSDGKSKFIFENKKFPLAEKIVSKMFREVNLNRLSSKQTILILDEISNRSGHFGVVANLMKVFGVEVLIRLFDNKKMVGIALLKSREDATSYSAEEYLNLKQIFSNVTIALGRSLLFEEIQVFNKSLQEKIEIATKDLREKNQDLKTLRDRERDMMDIVGHELRTPLSIIKMKLGLLAMKIESLGKITKEEFLKQYTVIMEAIQRESRLLETMISSTKIDSKHLEINFEKLNIIAALNDSIEVQIGKAVQKGISLTLKNELKEYFVLGDKVRLPEIFDNLIGNAIKYTDKGSVNIETEKTKDGIEITIKDTGIGIPAGSIRHLGTKFYRVGQYIENEEKSKKSSITHIVRPGGTGLGLYVTFGLVKLMKGTIKVESKVGVGSVFTLFLPQINGKIEKNKTVTRSKNVFDQLGLHKNNNNI